MWDDGHADRMGQLITGQTSGSSGVTFGSLGKLKRSISSAVDRLKGKRT